MNKTQKNKCHAAIHTAATASAGIGAGLAQIPGSDCAALIPVQVTMIIALGKTFNIPLSESMAKTVLSETIATSGGKIVAKTVTNWLVGWIPGVGNAVNGATAAAITESLGWLIANDFDREAQRNGY